MHSPRFKFIAICMVLAALGACGKRDADPGAPPPGADATTLPPVEEVVADAPDKAEAQLGPTAGNQARGTVKFKQTDKGIEVDVDLEGLPPGAHGFHIHEKGDCSAPDASSAGEHFNPTGVAHGAPDAGQRHAGDFGNVTADDKGEVGGKFIDGNITFSGERNIIGRAVIVHARPDDLTSQPGGESGARLACGVIMAK